MNAAQTLTPMGLTLYIMANAFALWAFYFRLSFSPRELKRLRFFFVALAVSGLAMAWLGAAASSF